MTLEQLRIFIAVAEREHVTRAAEALNLTQSAVSAAVAALETRHAIRLFDRVGRRILLTDAGRAFLPEARAVLARVAAAERVLADAAGLSRGTLRLAASQTIGNYWLPPRMLAFRRAHPGIALELRLGNTEQVAAAVEGMEADLGFVEGPVARPGLVRAPVGGDALELVVAPDHPWAALPGLPQDLAATTWIQREPGSGTRALADRALEAAGADLAALTDRMELSSNEAVLATVKAGAAAAILSRLVTGPEVAAGRLVALPLPGEARPFWVLRHRERHETRAETAFIALTRGGGDGLPGPADDPPAAGGAEAPGQPEHPDAAS